MNHPLDGLKVVELARILAGPWAGQTLSDLGAKVIKVESLEGDDTRQWGPPFVTNGDDNPHPIFIPAIGVKNLFVWILIVTMVRKQ